MSTIIMGGLLAADNAQVLVDCGDCAAFSATVTGAMSGTITFQVLYDTTEGWVNAQCFTRPKVGATATLTAAGNRLIDTTSAVSLRALIHPYVSGSPEVTFAGMPGVSLASGGGGGGGGASTIADGADVAEGTTTDAGVVTDTSGTLVGFARGNIIQWIAAKLLWGAVNEAAPASDTASSGHNGRLQRIAQRITSLITALGSPFQAGGSIGNTTFASTQSGTWTVQPGNTANTTAWKVDGSAVTQPVSAAGTAAAGAAISGNPVQIGGSDGTNARALLLNTDGSAPVGGFTQTVAVSPTITASTYTSGFSLGGLMTFANAVRITAGSGVIQAITVSDKAKANNAIDFLFFVAGNPASTTFTDHVALTVNAADLIKCKAVSFPSSAYTTLATNSVGTLPQIGLPFKLTTGTSLFVAAVARGTTTYASTSDLQITVDLWQD